MSLPLCWGFTIYSLAVVGPVLGDLSESASLLGFHYLFSVVGPV